MNPKRYLLLFLCIIVSSLVAAQNTQTIIPASSIVYEYLNVLSAQQSKVPPLTERPATKELILDALDMVDYHQLSSSALHIYEELLRELKPQPGYTEPEGLSLSFKAEVNLETYMQTDYAHVDWLQADSQRLPFIYVPIEGWFSDRLYARFDYPIRKVPFLFEESPRHDGRWINVPLDMGQIDYQFPSSAYLAAGGDHWNLQLGRDSLSYGSGRSGNFLISDEIPYHNFFRAQTNWRSFSFYYTAIDLAPLDAEEFGHLPGIAEPHSYEEHRYLFSHGIMLNPIPRLRITIKESSMLAEKAPSLRYSNPFYSFHNWYLDSSNSILTIDGELNLLQGVNVYGILTVDQFKTFFEEMFYGNNTTPNAYGYMMGTEITVPRADGYWLANAEWVYTNPWLYIHENSNARFIWTDRIESNVDGAFSQSLPLGYPSGPDSMNLHSSVAYAKPQLYRVEGGYIFRLKGEQSIKSEWSDTEEAASLRTPTGTAETTHALWCELTWYPRIVPYLQEIGTSLAYVNIRNEGNTKAADYQDLQWSLRISLSF
ncbi:MAG: hypothetical protein K9L66_06610 [Spirochaetaceae bacterium]|nr:hypothetical protein [Spirochaetaceae bacterium]